MPRTAKDWTNAAASMQDGGSCMYLMAAKSAASADVVVPGWDTATLSRRSVKRRLYWTGTGVGMVLLFLGALPDLPAVVGSPPHRSAPPQTVHQAGGSPGLFSPGSPSLCV